MSVFSFLRRGFSSLRFCLLYLFSPKGRIPFGSLYRYLLIEYQRLSTDHMRTVTLNSGEGRRLFIFGFMVRVEIGEDKVSIGF